jgi:nucleoside-diphosphate-sugar epimerase
MKILITGAAGNLGSFLVQYLIPSKHTLHLLVHQTELPFPADNYPNVTVFKADLGEPNSLYPACQGVDCIVHFAGLLFAPRPERFLPITNLEYVKNLVGVAIDSQVHKIILISFPHVEGETSPEGPAIGRLDGQPTSIHAQTRLAAERHLFEQAADTQFVPVSLRPGMIYGQGVLMIEAARWLLARRLLGVWRQPTWIHLLALPDFLACIVAAIEGPQVSGIYNLGDDTPTTLQAFLDRFATHCGYAKPWRAPRWLFPVAGGLTELTAWLLNKPAPLTRDFIRIGMASYVSNTTRMKADLLPSLVFPDLQTGIDLLKITISL